jgi:dihydroneopterin aldolase
MGFEDFNYSGFNQHILVDQDLRKENKRSLKARDLNDLQDYNNMVSSPTAA